MLLNLYKYIPIKSMTTPMEKYETDFESVRIVTNVERCKKLARILLLLNLVLILVDLTIYRPMRVDNLSYFYLYNSHIIVFILILFWFSLLKLNKNNSNTLIGKLHYHSLLNIILYWCLFLALNDLNISGQLSAYIICIFCISACLYLTPLEAFLTYFMSLVVLTIGLILIIDNTKVLYSHIVNVVIVVLLSCVVSSLSYMNFLKDFINKKSILESKLELEKVNRKLKEYEKLRTDFFANISHELRTPLNVIYSAQQMMDITLNQSKNNNSNVNKYLKMIKQNSYRLIRLIGNLIDITKIDGLSFEVKLINADIIKIVEDITMSVASFVESKGLTITFDTTVEERIISCDPDNIERILLNLLSNAVKFTEKGGSIFVNISLEPEKVCISVKDSGIGIPSEMKDLIFDRFIQVDKYTNKNREGSGIGLALVKSLVEMHGGTISLNSKLGEGSEFLIMLPDTALTENETAEKSPIMEDDYVKRISIEFSDIYD